MELLLHCQQQFGSFEIEAFARRSIEDIAVLRKHGDRAPASAPVSCALPSPIAGSPEPPDDGPRAAADGAVRLSALKMILDEGSATASWPVGNGGDRGARVGAVGGFTRLVRAAARCAGDVLCRRPARRPRLARSRWLVARVGRRGRCERLDGSGVVRSAEFRCRWRAAGWAAGALRDTGIDPDPGAGMRSFGARRGGHSVCRAFWADPRLLDRSGPPMLPLSGAEPAAASAGPPRRARRTRKARCSRC